jgi:uncharacterized protein (TIGR03086 family)
VDIGLYEATLRRTGELTRGLSAGDLRRPTPCAEWDVEHLVAHLVGANLVFGGVARRTPAAGAQDIMQADVGVLGEDPVAAYAASADVAVDAWRAYGPLEGTVPMPFGPSPAESAITAHLADNLIHQWDLAAALGLERSLDPAATAIAVAFTTRIADQMRGPGKPFGYVVAVPDDAPLHERWAGHMGRDPSRWPQSAVQG